MNFLELINRIEGELAIGYWPGAIRWCDERFDEAWSKAMLQFERALIIAIERMDYELAKREGDIYRTKIIDLMKKYKDHKQVNDVDNFLQSLNQGKPEKVEEDRIHTNPYDWRQQKLFLD